MKQTIILGLVIVAVSITGCTFNLGDPSKTAANAPATAANQPANTTTTAAGPKKVATGSKNPDSESAVKPGTTRVQFARGETSTYVTKEIPANGSLNFLFNVKRDQMVDYTVAYDFDASDITVYLGEPGDQDSSIPSSPKSPESFRVEKSGDHRLEVTNTTKKSVTVTLYLDVQ